MRKWFVFPLAAATALFAEVKLDVVFTSNMVLQQQKPIPFFGTGDAGTEVKVTFAGNSKTAKVGADGTWHVDFPAMNASHTNYTVDVTDGKSSLKLEDVLVGEVWMCSGQSNMDMPLATDRNARRGWSCTNALEEIDSANWPEIRLAKSANAVVHGTPKPIRYFRDKGWTKCSPETVHYFTACGYFFGRNLHQNLNVPIGLINASVGGTDIKSWISEKGFREAKLPKELAIIDKYSMDAEQQKAYLKAERERYASEMAAWYPLYLKAGEKHFQTAKKWIAPDWDTKDWRQAAGARGSGYFTYVYCHKVTLKPELKGKEVTLQMGNIAEAAEVYVNGKKVAGWLPNEPFDWRLSRSVKAKLQPADLNQDGENTIVVFGSFFRNNSQTYNSTRSLVERSSLAADKVQQSLPKSGWKFRQAFQCDAAALGGKEAPAYIDNIFADKQFYSHLYNGMVDSWTRLPIRGVIWYQGCHNSNDPRYYLHLKAIIADWRARWNTPDMPFLIVQLAGYDPPHAKNWETVDPNQPTGFCLIRDIQAQMISDPKVGLATAYDIGEVDNIHPANKQDLGYRLALEARRIVYGQNIVSRGPLFQSATVEGNTMRVSFRYADKGLKTSDGKDPGAFAIAGADGKFVWANAKIDGKTVVVSSPDVPAPKYVRYAYVGFRGDCNLQNAEGLPAFPFRSDAYDYASVK
ncbi:MAG: hypothetical protein IJJ26_14090 [Victivallales bacterium]|nr:hypothetical protein [Victivallales bacterium]